MCEPKHKGAMITDGSQMTGQPKKPARSWYSEYLADGDRNRVEGQLNVLTASQFRARVAFAGAR